MAKRKSARRKQNRAGRAPVPKQTPSSPVEGPSCSACGGPVVAGERFCRTCGAPVSAKAEETKPQSPSATAKTPGPDGKSAKPPEADAAAAPSAVTAAISWRPSRPALYAGAALLLLAVAATVIVLSSGNQSDGSDGTMKDPYAGLSETETDPSTPPKKAPNNGKLPSNSRSSMQRQVKSVIREHHQLIANGDLAGAFALMSRRKRARPLYDNPECTNSTCWAPAMDPLRSGLANPVRPSVRITRLYKRSGVAEIKVKLPRPNCPTGYWEGITWAKYEGGRWTYDPGWKTDETQRAQYDGPGDTQDARLLGVGCE